MEGERRSPAFPHNLTTVNNNTIVLKYKVTNKSKEKNMAHLNICQARDCDAPITKMEPLALCVQISETLKSRASTSLVAKQFSAVVAKLVCMV